MAASAAWRARSGVRRSMRASSGAPRPPPPAKAQPRRPRSSRRPRRRASARARSPIRASRALLRPAVQALDDRPGHVLGRVILLEDDRLRGDAVEADDQVEAVLPPKAFTAPSTSRRSAAVYSSERVRVRSSRRCFAISSSATARPLFVFVLECDNRRDTNSRHDYLARTCRTTATCRAPRRRRCRSPARPPSSRTPSRSGRAPRRATRSTRRSRG